MNINVLSHLFRETRYVTACPISSLSQFISFCNIVALLGHQEVEQLIFNVKIRAQLIRIFLSTLDLYLLGHNCSNYMSLYRAIKSGYSEICVN